MSNRFKLVLTCALFNLLFEYSARGAGEFFGRPLFSLALFLIYLTYFFMLEDLIVRFRFGNYQIFLAAFIYGMFPIAFLTGNLFNPKIYWGVVALGVNIGVVLIIGILAWGVVQGMITLYLANRISRRDWNHPKMGAAGWALCILYQAGVMVRAYFNPVKPRGTALGYFIFIVLIVAAAGLLVKSVKKTRNTPSVFQTDKVMDFLAFASVIIFFVLGTFFISSDKVITSQPLNMLAVKLENYWVMICGLIFFIHRFKKKSDIAV